MREKVRRLRIVLVGGKTLSGLLPVGGRGAVDLQPTSILANLIHTMRDLRLYIDYKSPYAFLAKDLAYELETECGIAFNWLPYTLDIPNFLGNARVAEDGTVLEENRTPHQWRRVRYSYMDARREANRRGLTLRGPRKIWDSSLAGIGLLYAKQSGTGVFRRYNNLVFERFWKRELNIEDIAVVTSILAEADADADQFADYASGTGRAEHDRLRNEAEAGGVFGVPTFVIDGELFWGREQLPLIRERLGA